MTNGRKRKRQEQRVLKTNAEIAEFLLVQTSGQGDATDQHGANRGVFARRRLAMGTMIPILGVPLNGEQRNQRMREGHDQRYIWQVARDSYIDCCPGGDTTEGDPERIRRIAGLINEPGPKKNPNCYAAGGFIVLDETLKPGQELLVSYGRDYVRDYKVNERWITEKRLGSYQLAKLKRRK